MRAIFVDDERSSHINFQYDIQGRSELSSVDYFFNPMDALEFVRQHPVDCAFLDVVMPVLDGLTLAQEIKTLQPNCHIIYTTSHPAKLRGVADVKYRLYKPYLPDDLYELLEKLSTL